MNVYELYTVPNVTTKYEELMSVIAPVNLDTLRWARENAGYPTIEDACKSISFLKNKDNGLELLTAYETGEKTISVTVADRLAIKYGYTDRISLYASPKNLKEETPDVFSVTDFRVPETRKWTPNLIRYVREVMYRQSLLEVLIFNDEKPMLSWIAKFSGKSSDLIADEMRRLLWGDKKPPADLWGWIFQAENMLGISVTQPSQHYTYSIGNEISGITLKSDKLPVIVLNLNDNEEFRLFTLCLEIAHLMIGYPGISHHNFHSQLNSNMSEVEDLCIKIAEQIIMPAKLFKSIWNNDASKLSEGRIKAIMDEFGASFSMSVMRSKRLGLMDDKQVSEMIKQNIPRRQKRNEKQETLKSRGNGNFRHRQSEIAEERAGPRMTRRVLQAYDDGRISVLDLHDIFMVRLNHLPAIAKNCGHSLIKWQGAAP